MRKRLASLLRSLADRLGGRVDNPWASVPYGFGERSDDPWAAVSSVPDFEASESDLPLPLFVDDTRSVEERNVAWYVARRLGFVSSDPDLTPTIGPDSRTYRFSAFEGGFSSAFKVLNNPVDLAAELSRAALRETGRDGAEPARDAYEQLRFERGYQPEEISFVARPDRGAIDIVISAPGSARKRPAARRRP